MSGGGAGSGIPLSRNERSKLARGDCFPFTWGLVVMRVDVSKTHRRGLWAGAVLRRRSDFVFERISDPMAK